MTPDPALVLPGGADLADGFGEPGAEARISAVTREARRLRREATIEEQLLWERLRGRRLGGLHFRRKHPIGPYIVDFCCLPRRLVVELDGFPRPDPLRDQRAEARTRWLRQAGFCVLRFQNEAAHIELDAIVGIILKAAERAGA